MNELIIISGNHYECIFRRSGTASEKLVVVEGLTLREINDFNSSKKHSITSFKRSVLILGSLYLCDFRIVLPLLIIT